MLHLKQIDAITVIQAFICYRFSYCNSLFYGASDGLIQKLQSVQNAAARLFTGARRCDHISHLLVQLHWLPVRRRVEYKVACLVHQSLSGQAPAYLTDNINLVSGRRLLRSAVDRTCVVPRTTIRRPMATRVSLLRVRCVEQSAIELATRH